MATRDEVLELLKTVKAPTGEDIVSAGVVRALGVADTGVRFVLEVPPSQGDAWKPVKAQAEEVLKAANVGNVNVALTAEGPPPSLGAKPKPKPQGPQAIPGIASVVAIASGKGGVGKSTVSANIACALAQMGRKVGLLDADVYGPSQPRMLGVSGRPASPDGKTILPLRNHGVTMMSLGLMINDGEAAVWRGPMLMGALQQMLMQVQWGALDVLIVDLPPGTGDVQMTLAQKTEVAGAVVVSTPQDVALIDARRGINMFEKMNVPILGMVENMSTHICSNCGHEEHVFGHGGVAAEAEKMGVPLLAEVPLDLQIRLAADGGAPIVVSQPDSAQAQAFHKVAQALVDAGVA